MQKNVDAANLWQATNGQWRMGMCSPIGLDYNAVYTVAEKTLGIRIDTAMLQKIQALEAATLEQISKSLNTAGNR